MNTHKSPTNPAFAKPAASPAHGGPSPHEQAVLDAIRATPFGTVEVVVHQSKIVQVVKTEKIRLEVA